DAAPTRGQKPIVFLSHSPKDKEPLLKLKRALEKRAAGSIDFFLTSDGQSLPFGKNWLVGISDALNEARLMFVFLSDNSSSSKWVYFEAGHAYAKKINVVPVCFPGLSIERTGAPL